MFSLKTWFPMSWSMTGFTEDLVSTAEDSLSIVLADDWFTVHLSSTVLVDDWFH